MSNKITMSSAITGDFNLSSSVAIYNVANGSSFARSIALSVQIGDGTKNLNTASGTTLTFIVAVGGVKGSAVTGIVSGDSKYLTMTQPVAVPSGATLTLYCASDDAGDTDVGCIVHEVDEAPMSPATAGRQPAIDASGVVDAQVKGIDANQITAASIAASALNGKGDWLDAVGVRTAVGLVAANLDTQLGDIPTVSELNARTLLASAYFNAATTDVTVGTNNDKSGYSISGTKTTLDDLNDIDGSGLTVDLNANQSSVTIGTVTNNTDMVDISGISTFNPETDTVTTDTASRNASKADLTGIATATDVSNAQGAIINQGNSAWGTATGFATAGDEMDLVNAPNAMAVAAIQSGLSTLTATQVLAAGDIDGYTIEETLKICLAALAGKLSGAASTNVEIRAVDDSKSRITATVDADGNRSSVTLDGAG